MDALPAKRNRDAAFFAFTRSICPTCKKVIDAHIVLRDEQVWMQKKCPRTDSSRCRCRATPSTT